MALLCNDVLSLSIHSFFGICIYASFSCESKLNTWPTVDQHLPYSYLLSDQMHSFPGFVDGRVHFLLQSLTMDFQKLLLHFIHRKVSHFLSLSTRSNEQQVHHLSYLDHTCTNLYGCYTETL